MRFRKTSGGLFAGIASIGAGMASIGDGMASIFGSFGRAPSVNDYLQHPSLEDLRAAHRRALQQDMDAIAGDFHRVMGTPTPPRKKKASRGRRRA